MYGANGKKANASEQNDDHSREINNYDPKREGSHVSPASLAESNGNDKPIDSGNAQKVSRDLEDSATAESKETKSGSGTSSPSSDQT